MYKGLSYVFPSHVNTGWGAHFLYTFTGIEITDSLVPEDSQHIERSISREKTVVLKVWSAGSKIWRTQA